MRTKTDGLGDVLVAEGHLVIRKRRPAAGAIRDDLVALVEQVLVPEALEDPPDRLDVLIGVRHVGIIQVNPEGDAIRQASPVADVLKGRLAALLVEPGDAVFLDLLLAREAVLLLDLDLHRQPVGVPAAAARDTWKPRMIL